MSSSQPEFEIQARSAEEIIQEIENAVERGHLHPGQQLPTVRALAKQLSLSPATVAAAYKGLGQRGVVVSSGRRGSHIAEQSPNVHRFEPPVPAELRNLSDGNPALELLPELSGALASVRGKSRLYAEELNDPGLLRTAARQLHQDEIPDQHVAIVGGAMDGLERVLRERLRPGDWVAVEDPCFVGVLDLLRGLQMRAVPIALDDAGMLPESLSETLEQSPKTRAVLTTPRAQNPTGAAFTAERAEELLSVLNRHPSLLLLEDDHAGPVAGVKLQSLCGAYQGPWAHVRSVSKTLGPDLRLAIMAADKITKQRVESRQQVGMRWVSHILQRTVAGVWEQPDTWKLFARAAYQYAQRRRVLVKLLKEAGIRAHGKSGLNVWVPVREEAATTMNLAHAGWGVRAGEAFRLRSSPGIRITISSLTEVEVGRLAQDVIHSQTSRQRASGA